MLIAVIREYGQAREFWAVLFTHGRSMPRHEYFPRRRWIYHG
jgi:hypothetical protein